MLRIFSSTTKLAFTFCLAAFCVTGALAGPDDQWSIQLHTYDLSDNAGARPTQFGTNTTQSYNWLQPVDPPYPTIIYCTDHSPDKQWWQEVRLPICNGGADIWHLTVNAAPAYPHSKIVIKGWNPAGTQYDLNGGISVRLIVANDPSYPALPGSQPPGAELWMFDPTANGSSTNPTYTATLNWTGQPIRLDLVASAGDPPVSTIGWARRHQVGQPVTFKGAVVTSIPSSDANAPGLWLQSPDGSSAIKVSASWSVSIGSRIDCTGTVIWSDGVPLLSSPQLASESAGTLARARFMNQRTLGCDPTESLDYSGQNPVGLLVTTCGQVTAVDTTQRLFYIDDGTNLQDGSGNVGLRVTCPQGITLPGAGTRRRVAGIRTVTKLTLTADAMVNGILRHAGETLYIPVLAVRDSADVTPL